MQEQGSADLQLFQPHADSRRRVGMAAQLVAPGARPARTGTISWARFHGRTSTSLGRQALRSAGATTGMQLPGRYRPCFSGLTSATRWMSARVTPAALSSVLPLAAA